MRSLNLPQVETSSQPDRQEINVLLVPERKTTWFRSAWFNICIISAFILTVIVGVASQASYDYFFGQIALTASIYVSLWMLSDRPLINPIQSVVFLFYWWFGIAPMVVGAFYMATSAPSDALEFEISGMEALWIVAIGLPLYALAARLVLNRLEGRNLYAKFLAPANFIYQPRTLVVYALIAMFASVAVEMTNLLGVGGISVVNYLGGIRVDVWWVGVLNSISDISALAISGLMVSLVAPHSQSPRWIKIMGLVTIIVILLGAVTSGNKGQFVYVFFYVICALLSLRQTPPWRLMFIIIVGFLFVVEPFVSFARTQAVLSGAQSVTDRTAIFQDAVNQGALTVQQDITKLDVQSLFRGIYPLAGELTRRNSWMDGYWHGLTIEQGLRALVPRAIDPDKPDMDVGNFMARTVGVDIGQVSPDNYVTSVAVSLPFEFVGNYGWLAGVASFPILGLVWALVCGWLLSPERLSSHPLAPWLVGLTLSMETALGHYLASWRDLVIPLSVAYIIWIALKKRL